MKLSGIHTQFNFLPFFEKFQESQLGDWGRDLEKRTTQKLEQIAHGDFSEWIQILKSLPEERPSEVHLNQPTVQIGVEKDLSPQIRQVLKSQLQKLHPWRKGPFDLFGIGIDAEWRSDLKWNRVVRALRSLKGKTILDLGCGNGYYLWRMLGAEARLAVGVDSSWLHASQFQVFQKYISTSACAVLPLGIDDLPENSAAFDIVFSMGVLYHRRDPVQHLKQIFNWLRPGGEVVLETLVIQGPAGAFLKPEERYAKMRNVWAIPACGTAEEWLRQAGFQEIRCVDITATSAQEQRKTEWMTYESLQDFLNPQNPSETVEGYPAPERALFTAAKK